MRRAEAEGVPSAAIAASCLARRTALAHFRSSCCSSSSRRGSFQFRNSRWQRPLLVVGALVAALTTCVPRARALQSLPASSSSLAQLPNWMSYLATGFEVVEKSGAVGYTILVLAFFLWVACSMPTTVVELATAYIYGPIWGFAASMASKTMGSAFAFVVVAALKKRKRQTPWTIPARLQPKLAALQSNPLMGMVGVRLAPMPLGIKNYGLAFCDVKFFPYMLASFIVNSSFSVLWAITGSSCHSLQEAMSLRASAARGPKLVVSSILVLVICLTIAFLLLKRLPSSDSSSSTADESER